MNLHPHRQRPVNGTSSAGLGASTASLSKNRQFSPQRYDGSNRDSNSPSRYPAISPTRPSYGAFGAQQINPQASSQNGGYDAVQSVSLVENELSNALRGMAVEEDFALQQSAYRQPQLAPTPGIGGHGPHVRAIPQAQPSRAPFNGFPQPEFSAYYTGPSYAYDAYRATADPGLYGSSPALAAAAASGLYPGMAAQTLHHAVADIHGQASGLFYEYAGTARPGSQFFYPTQPIMFHTPPSLSAIPGASPTPLTDKKRDSQVGVVPFSFGSY